MILNQSYIVHCIGIDRLLMCRIFGLEFYNWHALDFSSVSLYPTLEYLKEAYRDKG